jgi:hypothetical protein
MCVYGLAAAVSAVLVGDIGGWGVVRLIGVLAILAATLSIMVPVFQRLSSATLADGKET